MVIRAFAECPGGDEVIYYPCCSKVYNTFLHRPGIRRMPLVPYLDPTPPGK